LDIKSSQQLANVKKLVASLRVLYAVLVSPFERTQRGERDKHGDWGGPDLPNTFPVGKTFFKLLHPVSRRGR
jgi:hypothetical protein